jgi:hypothetical protein
MIHVAFLIVGIFASILFPPFIPVVIGVLFVSAKRKQKQVNGAARLQHNLAREKQRREIGKLFAS